MVEMKGGGRGSYDVMVAWFYRHGSREKGRCRRVAMMYIRPADIGRQEYMSLTGTPIIAYHCQVSANVLAPPMGHQFMSNCGIDIVNEEPPKCCINVGSSEGTVYQAHSIASA
jgi:hypothetical protein